MAISRFGLLTDWTDSATETTSGDDSLFSAAVGIAQLNQRYGGTSDGPRFFLLHRRRLWNEGQGTWIGWERRAGEAARAESLASWRHRHHLCPDRRRPSGSTFRGSIRDHAGRRHAPEQYVAMRLLVPRLGWSCSSCAATNGNMQPVNLARTKAFTSAGRTEK